MSLVCNLLDQVIMFIFILGFFSLSKYIISLVTYLWRMLRPEKNLVQSYGPWALVTGSTDGIGKALAFELARKGLNVVLVSRDPRKLTRVKHEIEDMFPGRSVKAVVVDFSKEKEVERAVEEAIEGLEVGVVVNNVGVTYPKAMYFHEVEEEVWRRIVKVNLEGTTWVTRAVLKPMIVRRRGAIVNTASGAGIIVPSRPLFAVYAATKAYIDGFSRSLYMEYKDQGIDVQSQVPLYVATKMVSRVVNNSEDSFPCPSSIFTPKPCAYAKTAVAMIGYESRCSPYWSHSLQWLLSYLVPDSLLDAWRLSVGVKRRSATEIV